MKAKIFVNGLGSKQHRGVFSEILSDKLVQDWARPRVDIINCFTPFTELSRLAPNFCVSKKLLKSWEQGVKFGRRGAKTFIKSTPGVDE